MKTQQATRSATQRAHEDLSVQRQGEPGSRWSAPGFAIWAPVVTKTALVLLGVALLALIGAHAGANRTTPGGAVIRAAASAGLPDAGSIDTAVMPAGPVGSPPDTTAATPAETPDSPGVLPDGRVVLNRASEEDFRKLPGIGPSRAKAIVELRVRLGRFRAPQDLLRVRGIGRKTLTRMLPLIVVNAPPLTRDAGAS